jgi:hypothetical protein
MTIDHIGVIFYPDNILFRIIGRLAFPFFAYLVAIGLRSTKKPVKYMITLLIFGFISQIPYFLAFNIQPFERLNIFFSLFVGALTIYFIKKKNIIGIIPIILSLILNFEGSIYVILTIIFMNLLLDDKKIGVAILLALNLPFILEANFEANIQVFALFSLPLIILHLLKKIRFEVNISDEAIGYSIRKYFFYLYYPLHLLILFIIFNS